MPAQGGDPMIFSRRSFCALGICAGVSALALSGASAAFEPSERVLLVSQSSPGTGNDLFLRELAEIWTKHKMVPQLVGNENVTGALGENARRFVAEENKGNEHVLYAYTPGTLNQTIMSGSQYTWDKFTPIAFVATAPTVILVNASSKYQTLQDLFDDAKANPGKVVQGGGPYGGTSSIVGRVLQDSIGAELPYTPFKGGGEAVTALLGNHIQFLAENPSETLQYVTAGQMRILASTQKIVSQPDVKTFAELGLTIDVPDSFLIVVAPPGISDDAEAYYVDLLKKTTETDDWKAYKDEAALVDNWKTGQDLTDFFTKASALYLEMDEKMGLLKK
jgi:putative tricarboxylic transport membrane protein